MHKIKFQDKNGDKREMSDVEWIEEFWKFLQGEVPEDIRLRHKIKLSKQKAFTVIWYLQEHFRILPDNIEKCSFCDTFYDSYSQGYYSEKKGKHYCGSCDTYIQDGHENED